MHQFARVSVFLEPVGAPRLMIKEGHFRSLEDRFAVAERTALRGDRTAVHAEPQALRPSGGFRRAVVQIPDLNAPFVIPVNPAAVDGIVPVAFARYRCGRFIPELTRAVIAVTDAVAVKPAPTVIGESFRMTPLNDF